jgi:hydrazine synthase alpha subunit-like protein
VRPITPAPPVVLDDRGIVKLFAVLLAALSTTNPILFVTQVPPSGDFTSVTSTFGNHRADIESAPRGGDLWIRYADGTMKNLTRAAGFGSDGQQGANAIAVRDPAVHWSGTKALFSMVIGAPKQQYEQATFYWQIYEITGLGMNDTPVIRRIEKQPANFNNVSPIYGTDDRILFTTDRPRNGERHLYPQLDEYEEAPTVTGLWSLDATSGDLRMLNHSPSGVFTPSIDSFGRVIFTRWDHLQRDQQADTDYEENVYGTFDYADESANAARLDQRVEIFPEPRPGRDDLLNGTNLQGFRINHFFPWEINEDGTAEETLNHVGRHELHHYFDRSIHDDPAVVEFGTDSRNSAENYFQLREDPTRPGRFVGTNAPEFGTFGSGRLVALEGAPSRNPDEMTVQFVTGEGMYRDPLPLANGTLIAAHDNRLKDLGTNTPLTNGLQTTISYWSPDTLVNWSGTLWELQPAEVRARTRPTPRTTALEEPEARVFREEGVDPAVFKSDLAKRQLALIVSRNVTARDKADKQQPYNLHVPGGVTAAANGKSYEVSRMQLLQAEQLRGIGGTASPRPGRRVLARAHSTVDVAQDGSIAALVPARRAMTWQTTNGSGTPVVRERYWLTFQPGEVRVCNSCHGVNTKDQVGRAAPQNAPEALRALLRVWKSEQAAPAPKRRAVRP